MLISSINRVFVSLVGPSETGNLFTIDSKMEPFNQKLTKKIFCHHCWPFYDVMQKEIEIVKFVQSLSVEFTDSLKNNVPKYMVTFDRSCEEICNSKAFVNIATAGNYRGLKTTYIKHNLFHQSKLGRADELQNTLIVLFKSPCDLIQVSAISAQLGLVSELVDWYRDATSVPYGHLLIDF